MNMSPASWEENPASTGSYVSLFSRGHKRQDQRKCKQPKEKECQSDPFQLKASGTPDFFCLCQSFGQFFQIGLPIYPRMW